MKKTVLILGIIFLIIVTVFIPGINAYKDFLNPDSGNICLGDSDLTCWGELNWTNVKPSKTVDGRFTIRNVGKRDTLYWEISEWPEWGIWDFGSFFPKLPPGGHWIVLVNMTAPNQGNETFSGHIKITNKNNASDFGVINASLMTCTVNENNVGTDNKESITALHRSNTLYVGGLGPNNYTKIQDAIDNATSGDTVFVYDESSPYLENIIINRSIFLIGENKFSTVIDGEETGGHVISIVVNDVHLSGFTIQNCGGIPNDAEVCISSNKNQIYNNIITCIPHRGEIGLWLYHSSGNLIFENTIKHHHYGIWLENSFNNNLSHNYILDMWTYAIIFGDSNDNIIYNNLICNNSGGIYFRDSCNNQIYKNLIGWNYRGIILMDQVSFSSKNNIIKNIFKNNDKIDASFSLNRRFVSNNFWDKNFWNKPLKYPKIIIGSRQIFFIPGIPFHFPGMWITIPWFSFDWHPAEKPYDIRD